MYSHLMQKWKIDPADNKQSFTDVQIKLLCCRYWLLEEWECLNMAFPFWRLYYNTFGNASVHFKGVIHNLTSDKVILIPPYTAFSTNLKNNFSETAKESIIGKQVESYDELKYSMQNGKADHLFVHFNLDLEPDHVIPGVYEYNADESIKKLIEEIKRQTISNVLHINLPVSIAIHALIFHFLKQVPLNAWDTRVFDRRVANALTFIEKNLDGKITNEELASKANMATNSFARLFHENTNCPLQQFIRKKRIEKACDLMHHTSDSIDSIAVNCGFIDRQHFSRVFKQAMNITPAIYKKRHTLDPDNQQLD
jgi:AraC-like DNA-binding protein